MAISEVASQMTLKPLPGLVKFLIVGSGINITNIVGLQ